MVKAIEVAQWFADRARLDNEQGKGDLLTQLSIQKLLYFSQGLFYLNFHEPLFSEKIYHEQYGPVVTSLSEYLKDRGSSPIKQIFDPSTKKEISFSSWSESDKKRIFPVLDNVYSTFGSFSAFKLVELTHLDSCWRNTTDSQEIKVQDIADSIFERYIKK